MAELSYYMQALTSILKALSSSVKVFDLNNKRVELYKHYTSGKDMDSERRLRALFTHLSEFREIEDKMKAEEDNLTKETSNAVSCLLIFIDSFTENTPESLVESTSKTVNSLSGFVSAHKTIPPSSLLVYYNTLVSKAETMSGRYPVLAENLRQLSDSFLQLKGPNAL